jgi:hypothetical protein
MVLLRCFSAAQIHVASYSLCHDVPVQWQQQQQQQQQQVSIAACHLVDLSGAIMCHT